MYEQLYVINQFDLLKFGCPHCGCVEGVRFLSFGTCFIWGCEDCAEEIAVVKEKLDEVLQIKIRNTDIRNLIGRHPYRNCSDIVVPRLQPFTMPSNFLLN